MLSVDQLSSKTSFCSLTTGQQKTKNKQQLNYMKLALLVLLVLLSVLKFALATDGGSSSGEGGINVREDSSIRKVLVSQKLFVAINTQENIPMLFFGGSNSTIRYKLRMGRMFQLKTNATLLREANLLEVINLDNFNWQFSSNQVDNQTVQFSLTTTSTTPRIQFRFNINRLTASFKYDVIISGFDSRWRIGANYLAICHELKIQSNDDDGDSSHETKPTQVEQRDSEQKVVIEGGAFMHVEPRATTSTGESIKVSFKHLRSEDEASGQEQEQKVCILYEKWTGTLEHDPTLGTTSSAAANFVSVILVALFFALLL